VGAKGPHLHDPLLFTSGSLFTLDYLVEAIIETEEYRTVNVGELRAHLDAIAAAFPQSHRTNESQTEDDFIWPVLSALGWSESLRQQNLTITGRDDVPDGLLFADTAAKAAANADDEQWKRYAHGLAVVESKRWARPLDRASGRDEAMAPSTQMLRYLRRIDDLTHGRLRWGILTNGAKWRLYWAGARSVSEEFLEIDVARALGLDDGGVDLFASEADHDHWLCVFAVMFGRSSFLREGPSARSFHERARAAATFYEERVADSLSGLVFNQVFPSLAVAIAGAAPEAPLDQVRDAALILLYRLLFLLYAEDRSLLPVNNGSYDDYALRPLREEVARRISERDAFSTSAARIWGHISDLSRIIDAGDTSVGIPPYNGGLFSSDAAAGLLERVRIPDAVMALALDALSHERSSEQARYINYRDLSVQQLGSIYERLLEHELVRDEAGILAVRPNLFARKNTGSYYTPDELVGLILDETLEPLIAERLEAFSAALTTLNPTDAEDYRRRMLREADPASAILSLRVCDPAMGSGHFLVSLVDTLADHVLDAMAEAAALAADVAYQSPLAADIEKIRDTILSNAKAAGWAIDDAQLDDRHIVRRMVLKRCVYGVDKNPMAVELAKVALWLHTFTVGAPLSFIDHHLHVGDSLFGLWVRDAIDKASAMGGELLWNEALRNAQRSAEAMKTIEALTDVEMAEAHRSAAMYQDVELMTGELDAFVSFMHALDWLNLGRDERALARLWLDGRFGDPIPVARGRKAPEGGKARTEEVEAFTKIWQSARALIAEEHFLNWQIAFPGVWDNWASAERHGGFDAVVGNPPWDRFEFEEVPWFKARRQSIALEPTSARRKQAIRDLERAGDPLWLDFQRASSRLEQGASVVRLGGLYSLSNAGKLNLYKLFAERALQLAKKDGVVGLVVPTGIAGDQSSSVFFNTISRRNNLKVLFDFENQGNFFPDIHNSQKFCVLIYSPQRCFPTAELAFYIEDLSDLSSRRNTIRMDARDFALVNPNTNNAPVFRSQRDADLITNIYKRTPVLNVHTQARSRPIYAISYRQMINMASDSDKFRTVSALCDDEEAWKSGTTEYTDGVRYWAPLVQGRMIGMFDHRHAGVGFNPDNAQRPYFSIPVSLDEHKDPDFFPPVHSYIPAGLIPDEWHHTHLLYRRSTASTNSRTLITALGPKVGYGDSVFLLISDPNIEDADRTGTLSLLQANLSAFALDFVVRSKIQGQNLSWFIVEQLPVIPPSGYARMFGSKSAADIVREVVLELTYTAHDMAPFARDMGYVDGEGNVRPPFVWDEDRRLRLRAKLDALYFILYGIFDAADPTKSRRDISYIYSTFPIVERAETAKWGHYRSRDLCLAWTNALAAGRPDAEVEGLRPRPTSQAGMP
jgi:hypothetical protein